MSDNRRELLSNAVDDPCSVKEFVVASRLTAIALLILTVLPAVARSQTLEHFQFATNTGNNAIVAVPLSANPTISGLPLNLGDEIGVFTSAGLCVGAVSWPKLDIVLTVWGDDQQTPELDGAVPADTLRFRVWSNVRNTEYSLVEAAYGQGDGIYVPDAIFILSALTATAPPPPPELLVPTDRTGDLPTTVEFSWTEVAGTGSYHFQVSADIEFSQLVFDDSTLASPSCVVRSLQTATQYLWRVRGLNEAGAGEWSQAFRFSTAAVLIPVHFVFAAFTGSNATIVIPDSIHPTVGEKGLDIGDEVGAFTPAGLCVGAVVWEGKNTAMAVWGDNDQTDSIDGLRGSELVGMKVWRKGTDTEYQTVAVQYSTGSAQYSPNALMIVSSLIASPVFDFWMSDSVVVFGPVAHGQSVEHSIVLRNGSISTDTLSGTFAHPQVPFGVEDAAVAFRLGPGDSLSLVVLFAPTSDIIPSFGSYVDSIVISSVAGISRILLSGNSPYPGVETDVLDIVFGEVTRDSVGSAFVRISNNSINELALDTVFTRPPFSVEPVHGSVGQDTLTLTVRFHPTSIGAFSDTLWIGNNSQIPWVKIPLFGASPAPFLWTSASSLMFGPVALRDTAHATLAIRNDGSVNVLTVTSMLYVAPLFMVDRTPPFAIVPGDSVVLNVSFNVEGFTPDGYGTHIDTLRIESDGGYGIVALRGDSPRPTVSASPLSLDFGSVQKDTQSVHLENVSVNPLRVDTVYTKSVNFGVLAVSYPVMVSNTESFELRVWFNADSIKFYADTLYVVSNAVENTGSVSLAIALLGIGVTTGIGNQSVVPQEYIIYQNYPNPFNPSTIIRYGLPGRGRVLLEVFNILGQRIAVLVDGEMSAAFHEIAWNATVPTGLYFYRIEAVSIDNPSTRFIQVKRMLVIK